MLLWIYLLESALLTGQSKQSFLTCFRAGLDKDSLRNLVLELREVWGGIPRTILKYINTSTRSDMVPGIVLNARAELRARVVSLSGSLLEGMGVVTESIKQQQDTGSRSDVDSKQTTFEARGDAPSWLLLPVPVVTEARDQDLIDWQWKFCSRAAEFMFYESGNRPGVRGGVPGALLWWGVYRTSRHVVDGHGMKFSNAAEDTRGRSVHLYPTRRDSCQFLDPQEL
jgi:hypothetical protein